MEKKSLLDMLAFGRVPSVADSEVAVKHNEKAVDIKNRLIPL